MPSGGSKKTAKAAEAKKKEPEKKRTKADPLFPARPRNFRIGGDIRGRGGSVRDHLP